VARRAERDLGFQGRLDAEFLREVEFIHHPHGLFFVHDVLGDGTGQFLIQERIAFGLAGLVCMALMIWCGRV